MRAITIFIVLIALLSFGFAACEDIVATAESYQTFDVIPCSSPDHYLNFSKKADSYLASAQCIHAQDAPKSLEYYRLAGQFYTKAGNHLCEEGDAQKKMLMYISSGKAYAEAEAPDVAITAFNQANQVYDQYVNVIPDHLRTQTDQYINMLENPLISNIEDIGPEVEYGILPYVILGVIILTIVFFFIYLGR